MIAEDEKMQIEAIHNKSEKPRSDSISEKDLESLAMDEKAREANESNVLSPESLLDYYNKTKKIKLVSRVCPFNSRLQIHDASLKDRKWEDTDYLKDCQLVARLRRGNSLIVCTADLKIPQTIIARRGLPKFFDLRKEHLEVLTGKKTQGDLIKDGKTAALEFQTIFSRVVPSIEKGQVFNLYRSHKANGENAQISLIDIADNKDSSQLVDHF